MWIFGFLPTSTTIYLLLAGLTLHLFFSAVENVRLHLKVPFIVYSAYFTYHYAVAVNQKGESTWLFVFTLSTLTALFVLLLLRTFFQVLGNEEAKPDKTLIMQTEEDKKLQSRRNLFFFAIYTLVVFRLC